MWKSITSNTRQMAALEEAFRKASSKFKISELNAYQKLAIAQHFNCTTWHHEVPHLFCDNCTADCKCGLPDCGAFASYPSAQEKENNGASIIIKKRQVDAEQVDAVEGLLIQYYKTILIKLLNSTAHGDVRTLKCKIYARLHRPPNHPRFGQFGCNFQFTRCLWICGDMGCVMHGRF